MAKKVFCDGCGKEIVPPTPFTARFRTDVEYQGRDGAVKYRKVFRTFDFCGSECFLKGVNAMVKAAEETTVEEEPVTEQPVEQSQEQKPTATEEPTFKCDQCGRTFKNAGALKVHMTLAKHVATQPA